ncbi:MAG: hypothetical protein JW983_04185 [Elusimicrobia bacterium]|nr:hypothetical protein [Elusimicrobiota bacterium]
MSFPKKILNIPYFAENPWVKPIWGAFNDAEREGKIKERDPVFKEKAGNIAISLSTKLSFLSIINQRINKNRKDLYSVVKTRNFDDITKWKILLDIESLFFEMNSACELMEKFTDTIFEHIGKGQSAKDFIKNLIFQNGISKDWYPFMDSKRNHFMHQGAPYLRVILDNEPNYDLIITLKNIKVFNNPKEYFLLSEVTNLLKGFEETQEVLQRNIINILKK